MDLSLPPEQAAASLRAACEDYGFLYGGLRLTGPLSCVMPHAAKVITRPCAASAPLSRGSSSLMNLGGLLEGVCTFPMMLQQPRARHHCFAGGRLQAVLRTHAVANHGVSPELVARQFDASRRFFQLPLDAKLALQVIPFRRAQPRFSCQLHLCTASHADIKKGKRGGHAVLLCRFSQSLACVIPGGPHQPGVLPIRHGQREKPLRAGRPQGGLQPVWCACLMRLY